ncbi:hypothetical protein K8R03_03695 [Candidatus Kaiserbacteria bacterium]|nr:hypothetical protein [Candidatus Kaiserbacteria bacterium]
MDDEDKKDDVLPDAVLDEALGDEVEEEEEELEPALGMDEFGAGLEGDEKQWE